MNSSILHEHLFFSLLFLGFVLYIAYADYLYHKTEEDK